MFEGLRDKRVLLTGATGGLGQAMARLLAQYGARLGLHFDKNRPAAARLLRDIAGTAGPSAIFGADLRNPSARKKLLAAFLKKFGRLDILINNAGAAYAFADFRELDPKSWRDTFALNAEAPFYLAAAAFDRMAKQGGGKIINISSVNVKYGGGPKSLHYVASKAALEAVTRGLARAGAQHNVLANAIRCGVIDTPMRGRVRGYSEEDFKKRVGLVPLGRAGRPIDIARMALFLASEAGDFITGEIFTVAGGD